MSKCVGCVHVYFKPSGQLSLMSFFGTAAKGIHRINVTVLGARKCKYVLKVSHQVSY